MEWLSVEAYIYVCANDPPIFWILDSHACSIYRYTLCIKHTLTNAPSLCLPFSLLNFLRVYGVPCKNHSLLLLFIIAVVFVGVYTTRSYFIADCVLVCCVSTVRSARHEKKTYRIINIKQTKTKQKLCRAVPRR